MDTYLPKDFQPGITRSLGRREEVKPDRHLHVAAGAIKFPVLRTWATGFLVDAAVVPTLSGVVDVFDGSEHLYQGVIVSSQTRDGARAFEVERSAPRRTLRIPQRDEDLHRMGLPRR